MGFHYLLQRRCNQNNDAELKWFLQGKTNIRELLFEGCDIWTGDPYKQYQKALYV